MPLIVDSRQCHLWTDALHARQLSREALNKWDRGTYVRLCVTTCWTAVEVGCQDAVATDDIGYRFRPNLDRAIAAASLPSINWSSGIWHRVSALQERRKSYIHKFASLSDMFPDTSVANEAIQVAREAIENIYFRVGQTAPSWTPLNEARGWEAHSEFGTAVVTSSHPDVRMDDPLAVKVFVVVEGQERLIRVFPPGYDTGAVVNQLPQTVRVPINGIRVYEGAELKQDLVVNMRGNA